jgi:hypothetical protein
MHWAAIIAVFWAITLLPLKEWIAVALVVCWLLAVYRWVRQKQRYA